jgi:hypothetical protein
MRVRLRASGGWATFWRRIDSVQGENKLQASWGCWIQSSPGWSCCSLYLNFCRTLQRGLLFTNTGTSPPWCLQILLMKAMAVFGWLKVRISFSLSYGIGEHKKGMLPHPDGHLEEEVCKQWKWHPLLCEAGDVAFFDSYVPHRSFDNNRYNKTCWFSFSARTKYSLQAIVPDACTTSHTTQRATATTGSPTTKISVELSPPMWSVSLERTIRRGARCIMSEIQFP